MDDVIFISGDVHNAQASTNRCPSMTGQNQLYEFTSSGLSHTNKDFMYFAQEWDELHHQHFYKASQILNIKNYGVLEINVPQVEFVPEILATIKDEDGEVRLYHELYHHELRFNPENLKYPDLCAAKAGNQHMFSMLSHWSHQVINRKDPYAILSLLFLTQVKIAVLIATTFHVFLGIICKVGKRRLD